MQPTEVVPYGKQGCGIAVVLNLLREGIGQPGEPPDTHADGQVVPFHVGGADKGWLRIGNYVLDFAK